jgi:hypothetical protein
MVLRVHKEDNNMGRTIFNLEPPYQFKNMLPIPINITLLTKYLDQQIRINLKPSEVY